MSSKQQIQQVLRKAVPTPGQALPGIAFGVLADLCVVALLALSVWLLLRAGEQPPILYLNFAIVGVRAVAIGRAGFRYLERLASHNAAFVQLQTLRIATFNGILPRVPGAIQKSKRGDVLTGFVDDVDQLQDAALRVRQPLLVSCAVTLLAVLGIAVVSPLAALVTVLAVGVAGLLATWATGAITRTTESAVAENRGEMTDALLERTENSEVLYAYGATAQQRGRIAAVQEKLGVAQQRAALTAGLTGALLLLGQGLATLLVFILVAPQLGAGLSAPLFAVLVLVPAAIGEVFTQVPLALAARRRVKASAARVAALTLTELSPEIPQQPADLAVAPSGIPQQDGGEQSAATADTPLLAATNLSVRYPGAQATAVQRLSFTLKAGETLVVTGASGSGKTTLALALTRFLEYSGSYRIAGVEARELGGPQVRRVVGLCEQQPHIFNTDLRQNLKFARPSSSDAELLETLEHVGLREWATARAGLDTQLGTAGALISGGQAQRVALARALLADFPVIVLDEPTASVEPELAAHLLQDLLSAVPADRAVLLITHTTVPANLSYQHLHLPSAAAAALTERRYDRKD